MRERLSLDQKACGRSHSDCMEGLDSPREPSPVWIVGWSGVRPRPKNCANSSRNTVIQEQTTRQHNPAGPVDAPIASLFQSGVLGGWSLSVFDDRLK